MNFLIYLSNMMIPLLVFYVVLTGVIKKTDVYEDFVHGAWHGLKTVAKIAPTMIGLMMGVGVLRASGFLDFLANVLGAVTSHIGFPGELVPSVIVRMFSSSAATGLVLDIYKEYGPDSFLGNAASIMMSSTETIFYTMSVYFMAASAAQKKLTGKNVPIKKTRYTLAGAMLATFAGIIASVWLAGWM